MIRRRRPVPRTRVAHPVERPVEYLEPRTLLSVQMLRDINSTPASAAGVGSVRSVAELNGAVIFSASDAVHGEELWKTDGTAAGTGLLKDIFPGATSSSAGRFGGFTRAGNNLFFMAGDWRGTELWATDGTVQGTRLVADLSTSPFQNMPRNLSGVGDDVYFTFENLQNLPVLWRSDGTRDGTAIFPFPGHPVSGASVPVEFNGSLYFSSGPIWKTDGTVAGTQPVTQQFGENLTPVGDTLYYTTYGDGGTELWATDGTPDGGRYVAQAGGGRFASIGDTLYFSGPDGEVWKTEGTPEATSRVKDIRAGAIASLPEQLTAAAGVLYFTADDGASGREVWRSDGTEQGTFRLKDVAPGAATPSPAELTAAGDALYFSVTTGAASTRGVWRSDGTSQGTVLLRNFPALTTDLAPRPVASGGAVYFGGTDNTGSHLWRTDGTPAGTRAVTAGVSGATNGSAPQVLGRIGNKSFIGADDGTHGRELWVTDGTSGGTKLLKDINPNGSGLGYTSQVVGNLLFFAADDGVTGMELWKSDGTAAGTSLVKDFDPLKNDPRLPTLFVGFQGQLYFTRQSSGLYKSDGTAAGTSLVDPNVIEQIVEFNGRLFYVASGELWSTDGTRAGSAIVKDINPGGPAIASPVVRVGDQLMFFAEDGNGRGSKLYRSDGTVAGTVPVIDVKPDWDDFVRTDRTAIGASGGNLFFLAPWAGHRELWTSDGTAAGTRLLRESSNAKGFFDLNGVLLYADTAAPSAPTYLWRSDGTPEGTVILDGSVVAFDELTPPVRVGNDLYFVSGAAPSSMNYGLVKTDGTRVTYVTQWGTRSLAPDGQGGIFVTRYSRRYGEELWRYTPDAAAPAVAASAFTDSGGGQAQKLTFRLTQDAVPEADARTDVVLTSRATGAAIPGEYISRSYDPASKTITFSFPRLAGGRLPGGDYRAVLPAGSVTAADGDTLGSDATLDFTAGANSPIVGRGMFYSPAGLSPGGFIPGPVSVFSDKRALLPGQTTTFANITAHACGLTGVAIDFATLPKDVAPTISDLLFDWNRNGSPWPAAVEFHRGAGAGGSDRLLVLWPPNVMRGGWLQVIVRPTPNTGLLAPDVSYFGNLPGATGDVPAGTYNLFVGVRDELKVRSRLFSASVVRGTGYDFNGDGRVNALDLLVVRRARGLGLGLFTAPSNLPPLL